MKALFIQSFLLMTLLSLVGCGSKEKPVNLEVSSSFALGAAGFTGGLIAYGDGPNSKKFSVSTDSGKSVTANIVDGAWKIYVVGWEGAGMFQGARHCGMLTANLGSSDSSIKINISTAQCADAVFQADIGIQDLYTTSCGGFYKYNPVTDVYTNPVPSDDTYCATQPTTLSYSHSHYKIVAQNIQDQGSSQGISSSCLSTIGIRRFLPTKKIPFTIKTYPTLVECLNSTNPQVAFFNFPNGIEAGNAPSFGHEFILNGAQARLSLPSFMTRRGRSPFMAMLPRVLCGASASFTDCLPDPTNSKHVNVRFSSNSGPSDNRQLLLKGVGNVSTVPGGLFPSLTYFNVSDLQIESGNLYGSVDKNALTCQDSGENAGMKDIYKKNDLIYMLFNNGTDSWFKVYTPQGKEIRKHYMSGEVYFDLVASSNQDVFLGNATVIKKLTYSSSSYSSISFLTGTNFEEMELSADETVIAVANSSTSVIVTYFTLNASAVGTARSYSPPLKQMQMYGSTLYFYDSMIGGSLKTASFATTLAAPASIQNSLAWQSFYYDGANYYAFLNSGSYYIKKYSGPPFSAATDLTVALTSSTGNKQMIGFNSNVYLADSDSTNLQIFNGTVLATSIDNISGECNESAAITIGSVSETLTINTKVDDSVYRLFEQGFEMAGTRFISDSKAFYYFQRLEPEGNEPRTGGQLSHAQDMLGPNGVASFVSEYATCTALKTAITASGPITRTRTFFDISENKTQSYTATAQIINEAVNTYFCNDADPNAVSCSPSDAFDVQITYQSNNPGEIDKGKIKILCGRKLGSLESYESKNGSIRRDMTIWNTTDVTTARFESYYLDLDSEVRGSIETFAKTNAFDFWSRSIHTEESAGKISSSVTEFHRIVDGQIAPDQEFIMKSFQLSDTSLVNFGLNSNTIEANYGFQAIAANTSLNSMISGFVVYPQVCLGVNQASTQAANELIPSSTCAQNAFPAIGATTMSLDATNLSLDINSMLDVSNVTHPIRAIYTFP